MKWVNDVRAVVWPGFRLVSIRAREIEMSVDLIFFAALALFLGWKLYSVLSRRTGNERQIDPFNRPSPPTPRPAANRGPAGSSPDPNTRPAAPDRGIRRAAPPRSAGSMPRERRMAEASLAQAPEAAQAGVAAIRAADPAFDYADFLSGAKAAFEMILRRLRRRDVNALKPLLRPDVLRNFATAIAERQRLKHKLKTTIIAGITGADIVDADLQSGEARITHQIYLAAGERHRGCGRPDHRRSSRTRSPPSSTFGLLRGWLPRAIPNWSLVATGKPELDPAGCWGWGKGCDRCGRSWRRFRPARPAGWLRQAAGSAARPQPDPDQFHRIAGWDRDRMTEALPACCTCAAIAKIARAINPSGPTDWPERRPTGARACSMAALVPNGDNVAMAKFAADYFRPFAALDRSGRQGLFTGYYEADLEGSLMPSEVPRHRSTTRQARPSPRARSMPGPGRPGSGIPVAARCGRCLPAQVQGSGRVPLPGRKVIRVGYAGNNGQKFVAIGKAMVDGGVLPGSGVSMRRRSATG